MEIWEENAGDLPDPPPSPDPLLRVAQVWNMTIRAVHVTFKKPETEAEEGVLGVLASTLTSLKEKFLYIPSKKMALTEYRLLEEKYIAYLTWLLRTLYSLFSRQYDKNIYQMSVSLQIKILKMLAEARGAIFYELAKEYLLCLTDLTAMQAPPICQGPPAPLHRFVPSVSSLQLSSENVDLELIPIAMGSLLQTIPMQMCTFEVLNGVVTDLMTILAPSNGDLMWQTVIQLLETAPYLVRTPTLRLSNQVLQFSGFDVMYPDTRRRFLRAVESLVNAEPFCRNSNRVADCLQFLSAMYLFVDTIFRLNGTCSEADDLIVLQVMVSVLSGRKLTDCTSEFSLKVADLAKILLDRAGGRVSKDVAAGILDNIHASQVGLTGFQCRCGGLFCAVHWYSNKHECTFDYREMGAQEIRRNNPVGGSEKIQKI